MVYADPHFCTYSSVVRQRGEKYSKRLQNLINSINFVQKVARQTNCEKIVCLGDFFDKNELNAEQISALNEIMWADQIEHYFIVGNHQMAINDLQFSTSHLFNLKNCNVIDCPLTDMVDDVQLCYLPYILQSNRKPLNEYFLPTDGKRIIFSHNDIASIQMGRFVSKQGFDINEIQDNCDLYLNGHLHNGKQVADKIYNVGNLTGQNFSQDCFEYPHNIFVVDTETLSVQKIRNLCAFNFCKLDFTNSFDNQKYIRFMERELKQYGNLVLSIACDQKDQQLVNSIFCPQKKLFKNPQDLDIVYSRVIVKYNKQENQEMDNKPVFTESNIDYIQKFKRYIMENVQQEFVEDELIEVFK